ncbi:MAG: type I methionyl aminopeptidase [Cyclobacteriaceae bacterium]|nr:type I methionyl aminopeptidase [Cyclobacteriaceae bacterium]
MSLIKKPNFSKTDKEIAGLRKSGKIVATVLWEMINAIRPGMTTQRLDEIAGYYLKKMEASSAPRLEGFPGNTCISVNEIIAHGIPGKRILRCGDKVNIDVSAAHKGFFGDVGYTIILGGLTHSSNQLLECAKQSTLTAVTMSTAGTPVNQIARAIEEQTRTCGYTIIKNLCSHGVGKSLHACPQNILNYYHPEETLALEPGMVIAWEPYISTGATRAQESCNEWNLTTHNHSDVAQFEHTVLVTDGKPEILTVIDF